MACERRAFFWMRPGFLYGEEGEPAGEKEKQPVLFCKRIRAVGVIRERFYQLRGSLLGSVWRVTAGCPGRLFRRKSV